MNLINVLFIENSVGLAGSTMSLCSLLDYLDADLFEAHIALSRNEQEGYLLGHLRRPAHMTVIAPRVSLRQASWAQRLLDFTQRRVPWLRGSVARAIAALEVFVVTIPYALRLRRWIKDRNIALIHHNNGFDVGALLLSYMLRVPLIAYQRGDEWNSPLVRWLAPRVTRYIANSEATKRNLVSIGVPPSLGTSSLKEIFARVRAEPGKLNWASTTGATELIINAFFKTSGLNMARIPYRDGVQAQNDVAEGRLHLYWAAYAIVRPQALAGRINIAAVTATEPTTILPGVPTVAQAGFPELTFDGLVGLFGTRDTPLALRERIAADVKAALADPTIVERLTATGQVVSPGSAAEFAASIEKQSAGIARFAKVLGIQAATTE